MNDIYEKSILLIGGMAIGKSTISELLGKELNMNTISIDAEKDKLWSTIPNYSLEKQLEIRKQYGFDAEVKFLLPYLHMTLNNILEYLTTPSIIDIGALNTVGLNDISINKIKQFKNIILLKSKDLKSILKRRNIEQNNDLERIYIETHQNPENRQLSTQIIYANNKTPEEIVNEIINLNCHKKRH